MATEAQIKRERKDGLRALRRLQREADTSIERLERRIFRLLDRKTPLNLESAETLVPLYNDFVKKAVAMENGLTDLLTLIVST